MKAHHSVFSKKTVAALVALAITLVATTAALAAASVARFDAQGVVFGVGPGANYAVNSQFIRAGRNHDLKLVIIRTTDEQVGGALVPGVTSCDDRDGGNSCANISGLLTGSGVLSFHDSLALLSDITVLPNFLGPGVDAVTGSLNGVLSGDFTIANPAAGSATGKTILRIGGSGVYACFGAGFAPIPMSACEAGLGLFVPISLDITDRGVFTMTDFTGAFESLSFLGGKLEVNVNGPTGVPNLQVGTIAVEDGRALFH